MTEPIRAFPSRTVPLARRSSWLLRLLFAVVLVGILVEGGVVLSLLGWTFLRMTDDYEAMPNVRDRSIVRSVVPLIQRAQTDVEAWDRHGPMNILLLGLDEDDCLEPDGTYRRTDTIILVRVDPQAGRVAMLSVPRDLYVSVPLHVDGETRISGRKINTAHVMGEQDESIPGGGPELMERVIETNLGVPVHRYARIDYQGFKRIIDAMGGVDIEVPPSPYDPDVGLYDAEYPDGHCGTMTIEFPPGLQHFDGEQALQYARSRSTTSDFDRSRRQMEVLMALRRKAAGMDVIRRLPEAVPALLDSVDTDFSPSELFSLASIAKDVEASDIVALRIDESIVYDDRLMIDGVQQAVLRLQPSAYEKLRADFLEFGVSEVTTNPEAESGVN